MRHLSLLALLLALWVGDRAHAQESRQLVDFPAPMQEHLLTNMRDHLSTLDQVLANISAGKFEKAGKLLEERLGMSSLTAHDAAHMAPFMPKPMQEMGTAMHHAASQLVITLQNASVSASDESFRQVLAGMHQVTTACTSCHAAYRIR
jgi:roadblock/LC7 domain-containing protein